MARLHVPLRLLARFAAPLVLLMISVHALTPLGQPMQRAPGSAFSAETVEVSLRSGQRAALVKQAEALAPMPAVPSLGAAQTFSRAIAALSPPAAVPGLGSTGPPRLARTAFSPLSPRAPPAA